jgi:hypothetical protein
VFAIIEVGGVSEVAEVLGIGEGTVKTHLHHLPDRNAFGSATLATKAVASAGPTPGMSSSRLLVSLDRCQAMIIRSNSRICALIARS